MSILTDRMNVLDLIENGNLSVAEGLRRLNEIQNAPLELPKVESSQSGSASAKSSPNAKPTLPPEFRGWQLWWLAPAYIGFVLTLLGGGLMFWAYRAADNQLTFWFFVWAVLAASGLAVILFSFLSRQMRWIHLRVNTGQDEWPRQIKISLPLPLRLTSWFLRLFGDRIPSLKNTRVDDLILALGDFVTPDNPLYIAVDDDNSGEKVQVYIG